jgi:Leucine-rich repeat (LRR) protein
LSQIKLTVFKADIVKGFGPLAVHLRHLNYPLPNFRLAADALAAGTSRLQGLTTLTSLQSFSCQGVTGSGQQSLAALTSLRALKLSHSIVGDELLSGLHNLETLSLDTTNITDPKLQSLEAMPNLCTLELQYCNGVTDAGLIHLRGLTSLRVLKLRYLTNVTNAGVALLSGLANLQCLDLTATRITDECDLTPFHLLQKLILAQTDVTGATVPNVSTLKCLDMVGTKTAGAFLGRLQTFMALEELFLSHTPITDADLSLATLPPSLHTLHLGGCKLNGSGFVKPSPLHSSLHSPLRSLDMSFCAATDHTLAFLHLFPHLTQLDMSSNNALTSEGLLALQPLQSLTSVSLSECTKLTHLPLRCLGCLTSLTVSWCKNLIDARHVPSSLTDLDLSNTSLRNDGLPVWKTQPRLRRLRLTRTYIDDKGLEGIQVANRMERLDLHRTAITDACMPILSILPSLQSVDVSGTMITNVSALSHVDSVFHWYVPN